MLSTFIEKPTYEDDEYIREISANIFKLNEVNEQLREYNINVEKYEKYYRNKRKIC